MEKILISHRLRDISPAIFKKYSYCKDEQGNHLVIHYDINGNEVGFKKTYDDRTYDFMGSVKKAVPFGLNLFRSGGNTITIAETEIDCLSIAETFDGKWPVISLNNGIKTAKEELAPYMEKINSYEKIVLYFKNNKESQEMAKEVALLFPPGKVFTIYSTEYVDANAALKAGKSVLKNIFYESKEINPSGIVNFGDETFDEFMKPSASDEFYDTLYSGIDVSKSAITTFVSGTGMGKTTSVKEIAYDLRMRHKLKIGYIGLEESLKMSKRGFMGIHLSKPLMQKRYWKEYQQDEDNIEELKETYSMLSQDDNIILYDHFGSLDSEVLLNKLRYLAISRSCDFIVLDHLSIVVSGLDTGGNETKTIDILMTRLRSLAQETGVGILLISHLNKTDGSGHEEGGQISLNHIRGSKAISQISDQIIGLEGNQQEEDVKNIRSFRMVKDRDGSSGTGIISQAEFNRETGRLLPIHSPDWPVDKNITEDQIPF